MLFPDRPYAAIEDFFLDYVDGYRRASASLDPAALAWAAALLRTAYEDGRWVFSCGNGGSASIANHLVCDHVKGAATDNALKPRVLSLSSNIELMTALANDESYDDVFVRQLRALASPCDVLVTISSSGDSENVVRAQRWARDYGLVTIALAGFAEGRSAELADVALHCESDNYGITEDVHQSIMHALAQYLRQVAMVDELVAGRTF